MFVKDSIFTVQATIGEKNYAHTFEAVNGDEVMFPIPIIREERSTTILSFTSENEEILMSNYEVHLLNLKFGRLYYYDEEDRLIKEENGYEEIVYSDFTSKNQPRQRKYKHVNEEKKIIIIKKVC